MNLVIDLCNRDRNRDCGSYVSKLTQVEYDSLLSLKLFRRINIAGILVNLLI